MARFIEVHWFHQPMLLPLDKIKRIYKDTEGKAVIVRQGEDDFRPVESYEEIKAMIARPSDEATSLEQIEFSLKALMQRLVK